jgi:hypothetical protein
MDLFERLEDRRLLSASPVADLAKEGGVSEVARSEPKAVARLAHRPASPAAKIARGGDHENSGEHAPTNPVAELATSEEGGAAVSELAQSESGAVAELVRSATGGDDNGDNGENGDNGNGDGGGDAGQGDPTNPVAVLATTEGGQTVSELAQSEPGAVAALVSSGSNDDGNGDGNGDGELPRANPVADLATTEGGSAVSELAGSEAGAVADLLR